MQYTGARHHGWLVKKMVAEKYPLPGTNSYIPTILDKGILNPKTNVPAATSVTN